MKILVKDFIFCDDIRFEEGRKFSIMGTYGDKLKITPKSSEIKKFRIPISTFIRFEQIEIPKKHDFQFRIEVSFDNASVAIMDGGLNFNEEKFLNLPLNRIEFEFDKSGSLNYNVTMKDNQGTVVLSYQEALNIIIESPTALKK